jgi:hypothetical protein
MPRGVPVTTQPPGTHNGRLLVNLDITVRELSAPGVAPQNHHTDVRDLCVGEIPVLVYRRAQAIPRPPDCGFGAVSSAPRHPRHVSRQRGVLRGQRTELPGLTAARSAQLPRLSCLRNDFVPAYAIKKGGGMEKA